MSGGMEDAYKYLERKEKERQEAEALTSGKSTIKTNPAKEMAEAHWDWAVKWLGMVYVDAFIHGYKHGLEDKI